MSSQPIILQLGKNQSITIPVKVRSVNGQVGDVVLDAADVGAVALENVGDGKLMNYVTLTYDGDNVTMTKSFVNVNNGNEYELSETVLLANDTTAGLMSPADVVTLELHTNQIAALQGQTVRLLYTDSPAPTEPEIAQFVTDSGYTTDLQNIAVVVSQTFHVWHWYSNTQMWQDDGVDTVSQFTNSTPGTIMGAAVAGKVYAESDGTGSVYGWDGLMTDIENAVTDAENAARDAQDDADAADASATLAESWAVGGTGTRDGEDTDNASYYAGLASDSASDAMGYASAAAGSATDAQKWADGTGATSGDPQYENNAKYYADQAATAIYAAFPSHTYTGNPATTTIGANDVPIVALTVSLPRQQVSGSPTPTTPKAITPWTSVTLDVNGTTTPYTMTDFAQGNINALTGVVTKTWNYLVFTGADDEGWASAGGGNMRITGLPACYNAGSGGNMRCSHTEYNFVQFILISGEYTAMQFNTASMFGSSKTLAEWKQWLVDQAENGTPVQVAYRLATSQTDTQTAIAPNSVYGNNSFSADAGASVSATVKLDPSLAFDYLLNN